MSDADDVMEKYNRERSYSRERAQPSRSYSNAERRQIYQQERDEEFSRHTSLPSAGGRVD